MRKPFEIVKKTHLLQEHHQRLQLQSSGPLGIGIDPTPGMAATAHPVVAPPIGSTFKRFLGCGTSRHPCLCRTWSRQNPRSTAGLLQHATRRTPRSVCGVLPSNIHPGAVETSSGWARFTPRGMALHGCCGASRRWTLGDLSRSWPTAEATSGATRAAASSSLPGDCR